MVQELGLLRREDVDKLGTAQRVRAQVLQDVEKAMAYKVGDFEFKGLEQRLQHLEFQVRELANMDDGENIDGSEDAEREVDDEALDAWRCGLLVGAPVHVDGLGGVAAMHNGGAGWLVDWTDDGKWVVKIG